MKLLYASSLALFLVGAGCSQTTSNQQNTVNAPSPQTQNQGDTGNLSTTNIILQNFAFSPSTLTVKKGAIIIFTNNDSAPHTITSDEGKFESGSVPPGATYALDSGILSTGTHSLHCSIHPSMTATLIVQ